MNRRSFVSSFFALAAPVLPVPASVPTPQISKTAKLDDILSALPDDRSERVRDFLRENRGYDRLVMHSCLHPESVEKVGLRFTTTKNKTWRYIAFYVSWNVFNKLGVELDEKTILS